MRIRSIKPEFWRSEDISSLDIPDRLLFIGLWSYVDDNGVGQDRESLVAADLFADDLSRDPRETLARVSGGLERLSEAGRIVRYTVDGRAYLAVTNWERHQRIDKPNKPRYPLPTSENAVLTDTLATPSRHPRETLATPSRHPRAWNRGTGEQGNRGVILLVTLRATVSESTRAVYAPITTTSTTRTARNRKTRRHKRRPPTRPCLSSGGASTRRKWGSVGRLRTGSRR